MKKQKLLAEAAIVLIIIFAAVSFMLLDLKNLDPSLDELEGLEVSKSFIEQFPLGSNIAPTHTRLPMIMSSIIFLFLHPTIILSRYISVFFAVMIILVTYLICREFFDQVTAVVSILVLSTSIYFLSMSHMAFTEGYMVYSFFFILSIYLFMKALKNNSVLLLYLSGVSIGLSIASKFFGIFLAIILFLLFFISYNKKDRFKIRIRYFQLEKFTIISVGLIFMIFLFEIVYIIKSLNKTLLNKIIAGYLDPKSELDASSLSQLNQVFIRMDSFTGTIVFVFVIILIMVYVFLFKTYKDHKKMGVENLIVWLFLSFIFFFVGSYTNLARPFMQASIISSFFVFGQPGNILQNILYGWAYYLFTILIKFTIPIGIIFFLSLIYLLIKRKKEFPEKAILLIMILYTFILTILHWRHPHYFTALVAIVAIIAGRGISDFIKLARKKQLVLIASLIILAFIFLFAVKEILRIAPYYNLYGHDFLPKEFIGATNIVTLDPCSGVDEGMEWLNKKGNSTVLSFILCKGIVENKASNKINLSWGNEILESGFQKKYEYILMSYEFIPLFTDQPFKQEKFKREDVTRTKIEEYCKLEHLITRKDIKVLWIYKCSP